MDVSTDREDTAANRRIQCPECGIFLQILPGGNAETIKCCQCNHIFPLPEPAAAEDDILSWLSETDEDQAGELLLESQPAEDIPTATRISNQDKIRLVKFDHASVLVEFLAHRLLDEDFRCSIPRRCLQCGTKTNLEAHVIVYSPQLITSLSLEQEHDTGTLVLNDHDVQNLPPKQLLERLPQVPNVPAPANSPMPYWLCDMCGGAGIISGQIQVNTDTGQGWCRLLIRNLYRADEFIIAAGGSDSAEYAEFKQYLDEVDESPWQMIPLVIQHRLQQWFNPKDDERFVGYIPDRDKVRSEDGMAGLIISSDRLIYHTKYRHRQCERSEPLELKLALSGDKGNVAIKAPSWKIGHFTIDHEGLTNLRRSLTLAKFKATWP